MDNQHWPRAIVRIRNNSTGEIRQRVEEFCLEDDGSPSLFIWQEGNFSCDCNRWLFFHDFPDCEEDDEGPCGDSAFSVEILDLNGKVLYSEFDN